MEMTRKRMAAFACALAMSLFAALFVLQAPAYAMGPDSYVRIGGCYGYYDRDYHTNTGSGDINWEYQTNRIHVCGNYSISDSYSTASDAGAITLWIDEGSTFTLNGNLSLTNSQLTVCGGGKMVMYGDISMLEGGSLTLNDGVIEINGSISGGETSKGMIVNGNANVTINPNDTWKTAIEVPVFTMNAGKLTIKNALEGIRCYRRLYSGQPDPSSKINLNKGTLNITCNTNCMYTSGAVTMGSAMRCTLMGGETCIGAASVSNSAANLVKVHGRVPYGTKFVSGNNTYQVNSKNIGGDGTLSLVSYNSSNRKPRISSAGFGGFNYMITAIGSNAFNTAKGKKVTSVMLPSEMTIGSYAFKSCTALKSVIGYITSSAYKLSSGKVGTKVGTKAFYKCTSLTNVNLGTSNTAIGKQAFYGCKKLTSITIKSTLLTKASVKNSMKSSYIKTVYVSSPAKGKYSKYKTYFKKSNSGKKVTVKKR